MKYFTTFILSLFSISLFSGQPNIDSKIYADIQNYNYNAALISIDSVLTQEPDNYNLLALRAKTLANQYKFAEALTDAEKVLENDSTRIDIYFLIGDIQKQFGQAEKAIQSYSKILVLNSGNMQARMLLANLYYQEEEYPKALEQYNYIATADSSNLFCMRQIGRCFERLSLNKFAIPYYQFVLEQNPADRIAVFRLSNILMKSNQFTAGIKHTSEYLKTYPEDYKILRLNGYLYLRSNLPDSSVIRFEKALATGDSSFYTLKYLGLSYYELHDYEMAFKNLEKAFKIDTSDAELSYFLGISCGKSYYKAKGIEYLKHTLKLLEPDVTFQSAVYKAMGDVYTSHYKYDKALTAYEQALDLAPKNRDIIALIALHYDEELENPDSARRYYEMYLDSMQKDTARNEKITKQREWIIHRLRHLNEEEFWNMEEIIE